MDETPPIYNEKQLIIGDLLSKADAISKSVISMYRTDVSRNSNVLALGGARNSRGDLLTCAKFLKIPTHGADGREIYSSKPKIADRIVYGINSYFPKKCLKCTTMYSTKFGDYEPHLKCFLCFQAAHIACMEEELPCDSPVGTVWLCHGCYTKNISLQSLHSILDTGPDVVPDHETSINDSSNMSNNTESSIHNTNLSQISSNHPQDDILELNEMTMPTTGNKDTAQDSHIPDLSRSANYTADVTTSSQDNIQSSSNNDIQHAQHTTTYNILTPITQTAEGYDQYVHNPSCKINTLCRQLEMGKCPHGLSGKTLVNGKACNYLHPRRCYYHCTYGPKSDRRCRYGENCKFFHPRLCQQSVVKHECFLGDECSFTHLKNTRRYPTKSQEQTTYPSYNNQKPRTVSHNFQQNTNESNQPSKGIENYFLSKMGDMVNHLKSELMDEITKLKKPHTALVPPPRALNYQPPPSNYLPPPSNYLPHANQTASQINPRPPPTAISHYPTALPALSMKQYIPTNLPPYQIPPTSYPLQHPVC